MPYIDTTPALFTPKITEGNVQEAFGQLLEDNGWTTVTKFKKAVTTAHFLSSGHPETASHDEYFVVAEHSIFRNSQGKMLGLALVGDFTEFTDHENLVPYYDWVEGSTQEREELIKWMEGKFYENRVNTSLYFYMLEKEPEVENGETLLTPWGGENDDEPSGDVSYSAQVKKQMLRMALDVEVTEMDYSSGDASSIYIKKAAPVTKQSPIVKSSLRPDFVENIDYPFMSTNWWSDSEIAMRGYIDSKSVFLVIQADNVPAWEGNLVPSIPLYFGNINALDEGDEAVALFAGTVPPGSTEEEVSEYDFDSLTHSGERLMPILQNYPKHPSNGVDTVMLSRAKFGARYQEYFLSWNVAPNEMPPERVGADGKRQYPRAYDNHETDVYKYQFSPSRYSDKVHTSRVYLVHPEEGVRGYLDNTIGLNSTNFSAGKLRVRKENCPEKVYDVYKYLPVSGLSPLTKRPGTPYRPMGIGIFESVLDPSVPVVKPDPDDTTPPDEVTELRGVSNREGEVDISWVAPEDVDFKSVSVYVNGSSEPYARGVVDVDKYRIVGLASGTVTITVKTEDINGNLSEGVTTEEIDVK